MANPITINRLKQELERLKADMDAGRLKHSEYDQQLSRVIQELRDSKLDANRAEITALLNDVSTRGIITPFSADPPGEEAGAELISRP
jgi:hypothetical protein